MNVILPGGAGQVGQVLCRALSAGGHRCVVLSRRPRGGKLPAISGVRVVPWDGESLGPWTTELEGADVVINLAGRSVNCRYTPANLEAMMSSRVVSTRLIGRAISQAHEPPRVWLQASTATIYAHRFDASNDEATGSIGGSEPGVPALWRRSVEIAQEWEAELAAASTPLTRKIALRSAVTMSPDRGGIFDVLATLTRRGLGGTQGDGRQYVSWIHEDDFVSAVTFLIERQDLSGPFNLCSPTPLPNRDFLAALRRALGVRIGLPAPRWLLEVGAVFLRTETELVLKSRRVVPGRLQAGGFTFRYPEWPAAAEDLARRWLGRSSRAN